MAQKAAMKSKTGEQNAFVRGDYGCADVGGELGSDQNGTGPMAVGWPKTHRWKSKVGAALRLRKLQNSGR